MTLCGLIIFQNGIVVGIHLEWDQVRASWLIMCATAESMSPTLCKLLGCDGTSENDYAHI